MTKEELLDINPREWDGEEVDVKYSYTADGKARLPAPIVDSDDEEVMADYIAKWFDDVPDISITEY